MRRPRWSNCGSHFIRKTPRRCIIRSVLLWAPSHCPTVRCRCTRWFVSSPSHGPGRLLTIPVLDLPDNRLGWSTHQSSRPRRSRWQRSVPPAPTRHLGQAHTNYIQWVSVGRTPVEIHAAAARGQGAPRRDGAGVLHGDEQERRGYHRGSDIQRDAGPGCAVFQQDPVLLL